MVTLSSSFLSISDYCYCYYFILSYRISVHQPRSDLQVITQQLLENKFEVNEVLRHDLLPFPEWPSHAVPRLAGGFTGDIV
jgi:hypothetical protein